MKNSIIVTGGGTAGHIMPIIAMLPELRKEFSSIVYVGSKNGMEKQLISNYSYVKYCPITTVKFDRVKLWKNIAIPFLLFKGMIECKKILKKYKPNCIFSKGGYVSLPVVLASKKVPIIAHESDTTLGLANKIIYRKCKVMCTNFEQTAKTLKKGICTGIPIRNFADKSQKNIYNLYPNLPTILIIGGSLGSKTINETVQTIVEKLCKSVNVIHIVGKNNKVDKHFPYNYNQYEYVEDMGYIFSIVSIAVSRAGANTIAELLSENIPMLLIPLSKQASRGDQIENAKYYKQKGFAHVLYSEHLTPQNLYNEIMFLIQEKDKIKIMQHVEQVDSTGKVLEQIMKYSK